jgi:disulfide bond formation protein DsbB
VAKTNKSFFASFFSKKEVLTSLIRGAGIVTAVTALAALALAYAVQDFEGLYPCPLCLLERWPYRIVVLLGVLAALLGGLPARIILALAALALLGDAAIAFVHVGVEFHWWQSPLPECNGILTPGAPLPATPAKPCDQPSFLIPGLPVSMAAMNFIYAALCALALMGYVAASQRRNR